MSEELNGQPLDTLPDTGLKLGAGLTLHGTMEQRIAFFGALAEAQGGYQPIARTRTVVVRPRDGGQPYEFDYAPLEEVLKATQPSLNRCGIAWLCMPVVGELHTLLTHKSGACLHAIEALPQSESPQKAGSALTYKRRYSYQCLTGTSPEYDDDGNEASGNKVEGMAQRPRTPPAPQSKPAERPAQARPATPPAAPAKAAEPPKLASVPPPKDDAAPMVPPVTLNVGDPVECIAEGNGMAAGERATVTKAMGSLVEITGHPGAMWPMGRFRKAPPFEAGAALNTAPATAEERAPAVQAAHERGIGKRALNVLLSERYDGKDFGALTAADMGRLTAELKSLTPEAVKRLRAAVST